MKKTDIVEYFGNQTKIAQALGITSAAVGAWKEQIPELRARQLEEITGGALKFEDHKVPSAVKTA
jgi:hypothetical protein